MNIIERISIHRLITTLMNFVLAIVKLVTNKSGEDSPSPRRIFPRLRKEK